MDTQYKATTTEAVDTMPGIKLLLPCSSPTKPGFDIHADKTGSEPMRKDDLIAGRRKRS